MTAVLTGWVRALLVPVIALVALPVGWTLSGAAGWPVAIAAVAAAGVLSATWLRMRGWSPAPVHLVTWAAPVAVLAPLAALGELTADGLVLWAPMTTVLAVSLALTRRPATVA
ncbi:hypothetical protein [Petropleomorpha daqingensis]|uniref:Uncharacterized protein n=1 Tax=Petropleomorpha daqingensis TaxID=2026353 RepID=A0A853CGH5_9ACTN|nr:hypothetical protein [Petropleomorpha daqingensis]NYJ07055.1 hypothetical protein [Petropleomorpha daqingensis]